MNKKGQALIEFVIILPIMLLLIFCVVDFGRVISVKSELENVTSDAVMLYQNGKLPEEINNILIKNDSNLKIMYDVKEDYITITSSKKLKPITPGLSHIPTDVFNVSASRVIKNE